MLWKVDLSSRLNIALNGADHSANGQITTEKVQRRPLREWLGFREDVVARHRPIEWGRRGVDIAQAD